MNVRRIKFDDLWTLFGWRLEQQTAYWSLGQPPTIERHAEWMRMAVDNEDAYIVELPGRSSGPIAVMEVKDKMISITVNPLLRGCGNGKRCIELLKKRYPHLLATVVVGNMAGLKLFASCGFSIIDAEVVKHRPCVLLEWKAEDRGQMSQRKWEIEQSTAFRRLRIAIRTEYGKELVGNITVPVKVDEPYEDAINYIYENLDIEEIEEDG